MREDPELFKLTNIQKSEKLYLICGPYNDVSQHFNFNSAPILEKGLKGIYEEAGIELEGARNAEEREFLESVRHGARVA